MNMSFVLPSVTLLQAYYFSINGVFMRDFPSKPPLRFNYTGDDIPKRLWVPELATKVRVVTYNSIVQLVYQTTNIFVAENHLMRLHSYDFYVVGQGFRNYNPITDPLKFNLVDPPQHNAVIAPISGWVAIRFKADNPGTFRFLVKQGETYLLRMANVALNSAHLFKIVGHKFTVVVVDASYTKPYKTDVTVIAPGQTTDVLITTDQRVGRFKADNPGVWFLHYHLAWGLNMVFLVNNGRGPLATLEPPPAELPKC